MEEEKVYEKGFKAYEPGLVCRGKQYEEGKTYEEAGGELCGAGMMHYCVNPIDVLNYYPLVTTKGEISDFTTVEALADPKKDETKSATKKLRIGVKLGLDGFIKACVDFLYEKTTKDMPTDKINLGDASKLAASGRYSQLAASGDASQLAASGDESQLAASGRYSQLAASGNASQLAASGDESQLAASGYASQLAASGDESRLAASGRYSKLAASGDASQLAASGRYSQLAASGNDSTIVCEKAHAVVACAGKNAKVKGPVGTWIALAEYGEWDGEGYPCICMKAAQIDGETIKVDTWYTLKDGEFVEVNDADT